MPKNFNFKRTSHVWDVRKCQLDQYNSARLVKDCTVIIVLEPSNREILFKKKLSQRLKEERKEIEQLLQPPLRKIKKSLFNQKFKFLQIPMRKLLYQKVLNWKPKKKKFQNLTLLLVATRNANLEPSKLFQLVESFVTSWTLLNLTISAKIQNIRIVNSSIISNKIVNIISNLSVLPKIAPTKSSWLKSNCRNICLRIAPRSLSSASFAKNLLSKIS